jgi:hypothetical protein
MNSLTNRQPNNMRYLLSTIILLTLLAACTSGDKSVAVPRQEAYPRIALYDTVYRQLADAPVRFQVNEACSVSSSRPGWYNIAYPAYGGVIYLTFTETTTKELPEVYANRIERIDLNLGGNPAERLGLNNGEYDAMLIVSPQTRQMPLQFLATDSVRHVISGAFFMPEVAGNASIDSLQPIVDAVSRDLVHSLKLLSNNAD